MKCRIVLDILHIFIFIHISNSNILFVLQIISIIPAALPLFTFSKEKHQMSLS